MRIFSFFSFLLSVPRFNILMNLADGFVHPQARTINPNSHQKNIILDYTVLAYAVRLVWSPHSTYGNCIITGILIGLAWIQIGDSQPEIDTSWGCKCPCYSTNKFVSEDVTWFKESSICWSRFVSTVFLSCGVVQFLGFEVITGAI